VSSIRESEFGSLNGVTYLNSASTGPLPERTIRALERFNRMRAAPHLLPDPDLFAIFTESRRLIARLINATPDEIALATNTSYGLNLAALALPLERGDVVLVSDREFPANVYPWLHLRQHGVEVELAPVTANGWPDEAYLLERITDRRVKVLAVSLVQFSNGYAVDLDALSRATRATGTYLVVDAIQGLGQFPVDLRRTPVDILSSGGQKWLLAPWGSGFMYVRRELI
jgi:cysteine desulfurase/selenocysteine lyase